MAMTVRGTKPKPDGMKRNRVKPAYEWTDVPNVPFTGAPSLPKLPGKWKGKPPPAPIRPLGQPGLDLWARGWRQQGVEPVDVDTLMLLCEQADERVAVRVRVLRDGDDKLRGHLRKLDAQVLAGIRRLGVDPAANTLVEWPAETKAWWKVISSMPHCCLWSDADWRNAVDTARLVAAFHSGDLRLAPEIRQREKLMGTTADARRDLRIRYIDQAEDREAQDATTVTALDSYRRMVGA